MKRIVTVFIALALVLSFSVVSTAPVAAANGPPVASGLVLHLDADAITGLSDGDPVATWTDLSGAGNDATQGTPANQPEWVEGALAGKPVVRFDGSDYLVEDSGSYTTPLTIFAVGLNAAGAGDSNQHSRLIQLSATSDSHGFFGSRADDFATFFGNGSAWNDIAANTPGESVLIARLLAVVNDGATAAPYVDGVAQDTKTGTMAAATGLIIGSGMNGAQARSQYWGGDIAEILIYDRTLTTQERVDMEWYLGEKWLGWERPAEVWVCDAHGDDGNPGTFDDPFETIQHGITVVAAGGTVNVKAGTYTESVTITNKSLTLRSTEGAGVTTITGRVTITLSGTKTVVFGGEEEHGFTIDRGNPVPDSGILLSVGNGAEVTISHNTITGEDVGIRSEAGGIQGGSTVTIEHNVITGCPGHGVHLQDVSDGTVDILNNQITANGANGIYIYRIDDGPETVTITGNTITGNAGGGIYTGHVLDSTLIVEHNTITDNLGTGIYISSIGLAPRTVTITHNTITGHLHHGGQDRDGIYVGHVYESTLNILGNVINENRYGINLNHIYDSTLDINFNNIFDNDPYGVLVNSSDEPVDATHNWWGDASGPSGEGDGSGDAVSEDVNFTPWLGSAIDPQAVGCTADRATGEDAYAETDNVSANATGNDESTTVTVAEYVGNPSGVGSGLAAGAFYFDVHVGGTEPDTLVVEVNCPGGNCAGFELKWFNEDADEWQVVDPQQVVNGKIRAELNNVDSSPLVSELTGTPFALGNPLTPVGGTGHLVNRLALLLPWLALAAVIAGAAVFARRRQTQS